MQGLRYNAPQSWGTDSTPTSASGASFVNLNTQIADEVTIMIPSGGVSIDVLCAGQASTPAKFVTVDAPSGLTLPLAGNTNEVLVRRTDNSNTPVNVRYIWRKFRR